MQSVISQHKPQLVHSRPCFGLIARRSLSERISVDHINKKADQEEKEARSYLEYWKKNIIHKLRKDCYEAVLLNESYHIRAPELIGCLAVRTQIALKLENIKSPRPLTHDLFKSMADQFQIDVKEVFIYSVVEGVFYCKIID